MKITIIGWYGTETIGDRAILAGILQSLKNSYSDIEIKLGSLFPFFSERTLSEDAELYTEFTGMNIPIELFNSKKINELDDALKDSDLLIMGGGPLMHIHPLFMVEYAFKKAKKLGKQTVVMGCGVGPLFKKIHQKSLFNILKYTDLLVLRDNHSKVLLESLYKGLKNEIHVSLDPAVICMSEYLSRNYFNEEDGPYIAVNLREFPSEYSKEDIGKRVNGQLQRFTQQLCDKYSENNIRLIPMHYFHVGGDDRIFLNSIKLDLECQNLSVQNKPLTLFETMHVFKNAMLNVGMRFHSVVFQTMLNGNNIILDYTEPDKGKIGGFISDVDGNSFYQNRYINLQNMEALDISITDDINENKSFEVELNKLKEKTAIYHSLDNYLS